MKILAMMKMLVKLKKVMMKMTVFVWTTDWIGDTRELQHDIAFTHVEKQIGCFAHSIQLVI